KVETGAAHEQGPMAAALDLGDDPVGLGLEASDREAVAGLGQVEEVMGHLLLFRGRGLGRPDVHAPVHLHGVDGDDLHVLQGAGRLQGERRLARGRGPDEGEPCSPPIAQTATTGIRARRAGRSTTSTSAPRRWCGAAPVTSTVATVPTGSSPPPKWTSLFCRVRPVRTDGSRLLGPSTTT